MKICNAFFLIFLVLLPMSPLNGNTAQPPQQLLRELDKIYPGLFLKIKNIRNDNLKWKMTPSTTGAYLIYFMEGPPKGKNQRENAKKPKTQKMKNLFIVFPRKGSFFHIHEPEGLLRRPKTVQDKAEIKKAIRELADKLKKNDFPSPKHRYGAEIELAALKKSLEPKTFFSRLLGFTANWIIFSAQDLSPEKENHLGQLPHDYFINLNLYEKGKNFAIGEFSEGMARGTLYPTGILQIGPLPYAYYRKESGRIFASFPEVRTLVLYSIDAHSLGPSGIQIENR